MMSFGLMGKLEVALSYRKMAFLCHVIVCKWHSGYFLLTYRFLGTDRNEILKQSSQLRQYYLDIQDDFNYSPIVTVHLYSSPFSRLWLVF